MIKVSRLNGEELIINANLIELVEMKPDTMITLTTGHKILVLESADEIVERVIAYAGKISDLSRIGERISVAVTYPEEEGDEI